MKKLNMTNSKGVVGAILTARQQGLLTQGELYAPGDFGLPLADIPTAELDGWWLSGTVPTSMFLRLLGSKSADADTALHRLDLGSGRCFLVVAQQRDAWQHRLVLPLVGQTVAKMLQSFRREGPRLCYQDVFTGQVAAFHLADRDALVEATAGRGRTFEDPQTIFDEFFAVTAFMLRADAIPTAPGLKAPVHICVSALQPPELAAWSQSLADNGNPPAAQ
ncbi:MAG: hypothetical protein P4L96_08695 [Rhodoferax sp.]|nr:hypothetical protein [Rhodoferax sp.]